MSIIDTLLDPIPIPQVIKVRQTFPRPRIEDGEHDLVDKIEASGAMDLIRSGQSIGIAVGSRGVTSQPLFVHVLVREIRKAGGKPFLFPAMGSHGGATADGQTEMLRGMGFGEEYTGAPIRATMEVVQIGKSANGLPVYLDRYASEADGIVIINRIKPHVAFRGPFESGLMKMMAIGMAKQKGAEICHELGFGKMAENIPAIGRVVLASKRVLFGVGPLENAYHETCRIEVLRPEQIEDLEPELQEEAKRLAPKLLFDRLDVLIIDEIGKDISGTGFDTNVVGRYHTPYCSGGPSITRIAALDVTEASHGNANGLGILDFTTRRAFDKFDFENTYPNSLTSTLPTSVKIPMVLKNQKQAVQAAIKTCNILDKTGVRFVRIKNTLKLGEIETSVNLLEEIRANPNLAFAGKPYSLDFNRDGDLF